MKRPKLVCISCRATSQSRPGLRLSVSDPRVCVECAGESRAQGGSGGPGWQSLGGVEAGGIVGTVRGMGRRRDLRRGGRSDG